MRKRYLLLFVVIAGLGYYFYVSRPDRYDPDRYYEDRQDEIMTRFLLAEDSTVLELPAGHFRFDRSLSLDGPTALTIRGAGIDKTVLSFLGQEEGAEGLRIANGRDVVIEDLTVEDAAGDNIKVMDTDGITFRRVKVAWTGPIDGSNGAYGFYPVLCRNVLIEDCVSMGASDAGVYVGQSEEVVVRRNQVYQNVAGIESENSARVEIYDNDCYDNTGGILVFNLPGLTRYGNGVRVYGNRVRENNRSNFGVSGSIVSMIPAGTGMLVLATEDVAFTGNEVTDHRTLGLGVISYELVAALSGETTTPEEDHGDIRFVEADWRRDTAYNPYPSGITVSGNTFRNDYWLPNLGSDFGKLFLSKLGFTVPDVVYDGIRPEGAGPAAFCVEQPEATFVDMDAANDFAGWSTEAPTAACGTNTK